MDQYSLESFTASARQRFRDTAAKAYDNERDYWFNAGVKPGARVADVGCGTGTIGLLLAREVGSTGRVIGVDQDPRFLWVAREEAGQDQITNVDFVEARAEDTRLDSRSFDVVMMRHVLLHCGGREQLIVNHLASLVRPEGVVYLVDMDLTGVRVRPEEHDIAELYDRYSDFHRARGADVCIGLRLNELLEAAGLTMELFVGRYEIFHQRQFRGPAWEAMSQMESAGFVRSGDTDRWNDAFERLDAGAKAPRFFAPFFVAFGRNG